MGLVSELAAELFPELAGGGSAGPFLYRKRLVGSPAGARARAFFFFSEAQAREPFLSAQALHTRLQREALIVIVERAQRRVVTWMLE